MAGWNGRARTLAVKIPGLGLNGGGWSVAANQRIVLDTIELFGTDRVMFGSNFPPDSLATDFDTIFSGFVEIVGGLTAAEQSKLLAGNARRIYGIE